MEGEKLNEFSKTLRKRLIDLDLSQTEAHIALVSAMSDPPSYASLSEVFRGVREPSDDLLSALAKVLKMTKKELTENLK